jgi:hypothetical protein
MVQRREMTETAVVLQKIDYEPCASEAMCAAGILGAHAGEIWGKRICPRVESTYTQGMYDGR